MVLFQGLEIKPGYLKIIFPVTHQQAKLQSDLTGLSFASRENTGWFEINWYQLVEEVIHVSSRYHNACTLGNRKYDIFNIVYIKDSVQNYD